MEVIFVYYLFKPSQIRSKYFHFEALRLSDWVLIERKCIGKQLDGQAYKEIFSTFQLINTSQYA